MSDHDLAAALLAAEASRDTEEIILAENNIAARLNLPLDDTEQGLTQSASDAIDEFCRAQGFKVRGR
jgi:hypothetical protein